MADISVEQKPAGQKTWMWAILAIVLIIALMLWLARQSGEIERLAVIEGDSIALAAADPGADEISGERVELLAVGAAPESYMERDLAISDVQVAAVLGPRAFWAEISGQNPFLVILGANVTSVDIPIPGQRMNVEGRVLEVTEQQIADWVTNETLSEGSRDEASFATHYLLVSEAEVTGN